MVPLRNKMSECRLKHSSRLARGLEAASVRSVYSFDLHAAPERWKRKNRDSFAMAQGAMDSARRGMLLLEGVSVLPLVLGSHESDEERQRHI